MNKFILILCTNFLSLNCTINDLYFLKAINKDKKVILLGDHHKNKDTKADPKETHQFETFIEQVNFYQNENIDKKVSIFLENLTDERIDKYSYIGIKCDPTDIIGMIKENASLIPTAEFKYLEVSELSGIILAHLDIPMPRPFILEKDVESKLRHTKSTANITEITFQDIFTESYIWMNKLKRKIEKNDLNLTFPVQDMCSILFKEDVEVELDKLETLLAELDIPLNATIAQTITPLWIEHLKQFITDAKNKNPNITDLTTEEVDIFHKQILEYSKQYPNVTRGQYRKLNFKFDDFDIKLYGHNLNLDLSKKIKQLIARLWRPSRRLLDIHMFLKIVASKSNLVIACAGARHTRVLEVLLKYQYYKPMLKTTASANQYLDLSGLADIISEIKTSK